MVDQLGRNGAGLLDVGEGQHLYWETRGDPGGKAAVVLHGGPGAGCSGAWLRYFDPRSYHVVLFDQRGCGRSVPHASDPSTDLGANTTRHLLADIEALRRHLGVDRWLVLGGSWGSTLGLAYAEQHPDRVSAAVLFSVVTTTRREVEWVTRHVGRLFPEEWSRFRDGVPAEDRDGDLAAAYARLLNDANPRIRERAAEAWCRWEAAHVQTGSRRDPDPRFADPRFRLCFARLVTHYWRHAAWLEDGALLTGAAGLGTVPGFLVHGRLDVSSPLDVPWSLARAWPGSRLEVIDDAGHTGSDRMTQAVRRATASAANPHLPR